MRYLLAVSVIFALFSQFVACGSGFYRVPMNGDADHGAAQERQPGSFLYGIHSAKGWRLPIRYRLGTGISPELEEQFNLAVASWETAVGKTLFVYEGRHEEHSGDSFTGLRKPLGDEVNGQYVTNSWANTDKASQVIATTVWNNGRDRDVIIDGDIRYNGEHFVLGDASDEEVVADGEREVVDMESVALHELGHLLGLGHVSEDVDRYSIMNPQLFIGQGMTSRRLSPGDIQRIQRIYGCEGAACDLVPADTAE